MKKNKKILKKPFGNFNKQILNAFGYTEKDIINNSLKQNLKIEEYTLKEFIKKFRPKGLGVIKVGAEDPIYFKEVICDICNKEVLQPNKKPNQKVIFVIYNYALCSECIKETIKNHERQQQ